jgi:hypothetical protein
LHLKRNGFCLPRSFPLQTNDRTFSAVLASLRRDSLLHVAAALKMCATPYGAEKNAATSTNSIDLTPLSLRFSMAVEMHHAPTQKKKLRPHLSL